MAKKKRKPPPKCKAILLCDRIIVDRDSMRPSLIDVFSHLSFPSFPATTRPIYVYIQLADGIGSYRLTLVFDDLREGGLIAQTDLGELVFQERPQTIDIVLPLTPLFLPHDGVYDFIVLADGQEVDRQKLRASLEVPNDGGEEPTSEEE